MQLVEAVDDALSERYALGPHSMGHEPKTPITAPRGLQMRVERIMKRFGGDRRKAAAAAGVPYSTWGHMLRGRPMSKKNLAKVTDAYAKLVTSPARALRVKKVGLPDVWSIGAVVVCDPGGSKYVNGRGEVTQEEVEDLTSGPEWRYFNAEGLDSGRIVDAWLAQGAGEATAALLQDIEDTYGSAFDFWGDHVDVAFHYRYGDGD